MTMETTKPFLRDLAVRRNRVERFLVAAHELGGMPLDERIEVIEDVVAFLAERLLPHAQSEEGLLYTEAERLLEHGAGGNSVAFDCDEMRARIAELSDTDPADSGRLQELLYALYLLASTHLQKEEEVYLRLLGVEPEIMECVTAGMGELEYERAHPGVPLDRL